MDRSEWWTQLEAAGTTLLAETWIPVGTPGFAGDAKRRWRDVLDGRFGADGWRLAHVVRGRVVPFGESILEYEQSYRRYLLDRPSLVRFLVDQCGNVYDWGIENTQSGDPRSANLCAAGRARYHRRGGPARVGRVVRPAAGPRSRLMSIDRPDRVPPRPRLRTH